MKKIIDGMMRDGIPLKEISRVLTERLRGWIIIQFNQNETPWRYETCRARIAEVLFWKGMYPYRCVIRFEEIDKDQTGEFSGMWGNSKFIDLQSMFCMEDFTFNRCRAGMKPRDGYTLGGDSQMQDMRKPEDLDSVWLFFMRGYGNINFVFIRNGYEGHVPTLRGYREKPDLTLDLLCEDRREFMPAFREPDDMVDFYKQRWFLRAMDREISKHWWRNFEMPSGINDIYSSAIEEMHRMGQEICKAGFFPGDLLEKNKYNHVYNLTFADNGTDNMDVEVFPSLMRFSRMSHLPMIFSVGLENGRLNIFGCIWTPPASLSDLFRTPQVLHFSRDQEISLPENKGAGRITIPDYVVREGTIHPVEKGVTEN